MNKNPLGRIILGVTVIVAVLLSGCYLESLRNTGVASASVSVSMKQPASPIASAALIVTGPGMPPITRLLSPTDTQIEVELPAGEDRTFRLLVNTVSVTFLAETMVDLDPGSSTAVTLRPALASTQILIPDYYNSRIVQIADIAGTAWTERTFAQLGFGSEFEFRPIDIDFDAQGRIYIANEDSGAGIVRIRDINATSHEVIVDSNAANGLAIDRANNILYFTHRYDNDVFRVDLDGAGPPYTPVALNIQGESGVPFFRSIGLAVDTEGFLYAANAGETQVLKIDPNAAAGSRVVRIFTDNLGSQYDGFDVMVREPHVYIANHEGPDGYVVQKLDKNLDFLEAFGSVRNPPAAPGEFWGPRRFLAILNRKLYLIDEDYSSTTFTDENRIVAFDALTGSGWTSYGKLGSGVGEFDFPFYGLC